jgi:hypothetical protein
MNGSGWKDDMWHTQALTCPLQPGIKINPLLCEFFEKIDAEVTLPVWELRFIIRLVDSGRNFARYEQTY